MAERAENVQKFVDSIHLNIDKQIDDAVAICESPIEELMAIGLMMTKPHLTGHRVEVSSQARIGKFRVDFLISVESEATVYKDGLDYSDLVCTTVVVECDGHDWHSSKEQIKSDNERDMTIIRRGHVVLHFSGSTINDNPTERARDAWTTLMKIHQQRIEEIESAMSIALELVDFGDGE